MEIIYFRKNFKIYLAEYSEENPTRWSLWAYSTNRKDCYLLGVRDEKGNVEEAYNFRYYPWDVQSAGRQLFADVRNKVAVKSIGWYRLRMFKMGRPRNAEDRKRVIKLRKQGMRIVDISAAVKKDISLVHRWIKQEMGLRTKLEKVINS